MADYEKVGVLLERNGRLLLCRKRRTTSQLILPGGCIEPNETAMQCLEREIREELGDVRLSQIEYVGTYSDVAAGEGSKMVQIELYRAELHGEPAACSEIRELVWFGEGDDVQQLAPSIRNKILPDLRRRGILAWRVTAPPA
jgi:ADP-ribose pyrophosphatase YjhB (NUDIX family)